MRSKSKSTDPVYDKRKYGLELRHPSVIFAAPVLRNRFRRGRILPLEPFFPCFDKRDSKSRKLLWREAPDLMPTYLLRQRLSFPETER